LPAVELTPAIIFNSFARQMARRSVAARRADMGGTVLAAGLAIGPAN
jgi:hypothetical protein